MYRSMALSVVLLGMGSVVGSVKAEAAVYDGAFSIVVENDIVTGSDSNYTNGIGVSWSSNAIETYAADSQVRRWAEFWSFLPGTRGASNHYVSWTIAQEMHTPDDITHPDPPLHWAPYAGVLYLDSVLYSRHEQWGQAWNVRLGVVGPSSHADSTQRKFHEWVDADKPRGWHTQLPDELIVNVGYTAGYIWQEGDFGLTGSWRVVPLVNVEAGNYTTAMGIGLLAEAGWNLPEALGVSSLGQGLDTAMTMGAGPQEEWSVSFFAGIGGYAIAHYLPLDGTVFKDSRSVESDPRAVMVSGGIALRRSAFALSIGVSYLNSSFDNVREGLDYGIVSLAWYH